MLFSRLLKSGLLGTETGINRSRYLSKCELKIVCKQILQQHLLLPLSRTFPSPIKEFTSSTNLSHSSSWKNMQGKGGKEKKSKKKKKEIRQARFNYSAKQYFFSKLNKKQLEFYLVAIAYFFNILFAFLQSHQLSNLKAQLQLSRFGLWSHQDLEYCCQERQTFGNLWEPLGLLLSGKGRPCMASD